MKRQVLSLFLFTIGLILPIQSAYAAECKGYIAVSGNRRAIYYAEIEENTPKTKLTLNYIEGIKKVEAVEYECNLEQQKCKPITEGAEKAFPLCLTIADVEQDDVNTFYLSAYQNSKCDGQNSIVIGNIYCR